jgi:uncharacterized membrane protein YhaH (DUF805 family)
MNAKRGIEKAMEKYFAEYVQMWKRWNDFSGKSNLREFWMAVLINFIVGAVLGLLGQLAGFFSWLGYAYSLAILVPMIALYIRRMHDVGKSGGYLFMILIPIVGWILVIIQLVKPSVAA